MVTGLDCMTSTLFPKRFLPLNYIFPVYVFLFGKKKKINTFQFLRDYGIFLGFRNFFLYRFKETTIEKWLFLSTIFYFLFLEYVAQLSTIRVLFLFLSAHHVYLDFVCIGGCTMNTKRNRERSTQRLGTKKKETAKNLFGQT